MHLYKNFGIEKTVKNLDGVFAFCIVDIPEKRVLLARDPYGVRPMFRLTTPDGILGICSEAKGIKKEIRIMKNCNNNQTKKIDFVFDI